MLKNKMLSRALLAVVLGGAALSAQAADKGFYAGAGVGQSFVDETAKGGQVYDDEDTAFSVFGGYQFNRYFALEGGYANLGKIEAKPVGRDLETDSVFLTAVGIVPITDKFSAYGKAGFHRWNLDEAIPALTGETDDSGTDPTYGVGLQYRFNDKVALRTEYSRFEVGDLDEDLAQLQIRFDF
jgi:OOP family OmpA-OmpF porin